MEKTTNTTAVNMPHGVELRDKDIGLAIVNEVLGRHQGTSPGGVPWLRESPLTNGGSKVEWEEEWSDQYPEDAQLLRSANIYADRSLMEACKPTMPGLLEAARTARKSMENATPEERAELEAKARQRIASQKCCLDSQRKDHES